MNIIKFFLKFFQIIFNLLISSIIILWLTYLGSYILNFKIINFQIVIHYILAIILMVCLWWNLFKKIKLYKLIIVIILFLSSVFLPRITDLLDFSNSYEDKNLNLIEIKKFINTDVCLDSGLCAENLEINTEYGLIKINKENCLKYNWKWDEKKKHCNLN